jgi:hypothetical protein
MRQFKHEILFLSHFLYVLCTLLDPDPDPNPSLFLPVSLLIRLKRRWLRLGHLSTSVLHRGILHPDPLFICTDPDTDKAPDPSINRQETKKNLHFYTWGLIYELFIFEE